MTMKSFKGSSNELTIYEDYIDMEITSSNTLFSYSKSKSKSKSNTTCSSSPPPQQNHVNKEFEFQMSSSLLASDKDSQITTTYFPADELFYKGKLLPLYLPPRLQMVQNILQTSNKITAIRLSEEEEEDFEFEEETFTIPFMSLTAPCTSTSTPIDQSCNISPTESCRVSCEFLSDEREDYLSEGQYWSSQVRSVLIGGPTSRSCTSKTSLSAWSNKFRQSSLGKRLVKASRAYLKSLFVHKPVCSDGSNSAKTSATTTTTTQTCNAGHEENCAGLSKTTTSGMRRMVSSDSKMISPTSLMKSIENEIMAENITSHRKSFSGVIQRHSSGNNKSLLSSSTSSSSGHSSSSSSFSLSSNGTSSSHSSSYDLQWLKRCSSGSLELESSIEGAIAHCKQSLISQQFFNSRSKNTTQTGQVAHLPNFSLSASRIAV